MSSQGYRTRFANSSRIRKYTTNIRSTLSSAGRRITERIRGINGSMPWEGSPWDRPEHKTFALDEMDLNRSYANDEEYIVRAAEPEPRPPRQQRWTHEGEEPLTDPTQLPLGWNADEPDLDPEDINAQITRAEERIADNIMPHAFQHKLDYYRGYRTRNDEIQARWPANLDWNVLNRLEVLTRIAMDLEGNGDKNNQLLNVRAIIEAYRNRTIQINGLVTYWSRGVQISQPRPFDWDEFLSINSHHEGSTSFWVEGLHGARTLRSAARLVIDQGGLGLSCATYDIVVKLPGVDWWNEFRVLFDTGADHMELYERDLRILQGPHTLGTIQTIGECHLVGTGGGVTRNAIAVEVSLLSGDGRRMTPWITTSCTLCPGDPTTDPTMCRLDGPTLRHFLYFCSVPTGRLNWYVSNTELGMHLPKSLPQKKCTTFAPTRNLVNQNSVAINIPAPYPQAAALRPVKPLPKAAFGVD